MMKVFLKTVQILVLFSVIFAVGCEKKEEEKGGTSIGEPPTCQITAPQNNAEFGIGETISVTVTAASGDGNIVEVQLYVDNVLHTTKTNAPYNFTVNAAELSLGTHVLKAVAKDNDGATGESTIMVKIISEGANKAPTCNITNPLEGAHFSTDENIPVTVVAEDADGYIVEVQLYVDNVGHSIKTAFPYNFTINAGELSPGTHVLRAVAKDNDGANGEATVNIIVEQPDTESPDFVTFSDGKIPNTWHTTAWYIDNTIGYDDIYSLKTMTNNSAVVTSKTCNSNMNFVEFYLRGSGTVDFYVDGSKRKVCALTNSWVKHGFYLEEGLHTFKWEFIDGVEANLDAIRFKNETQLAVGMYYKGGIIAYLDNTNQHGFIAAPENQSDGIEWGGHGTTTGATGTAIGTGESNTTTIVEMLGNGSYAAKLCDDLVINDYNDWFLPSKDELNILYQNRNVIGGFTIDSGSSYYSSYWSSSESSSGSAWLQDFRNGEQKNTCNPCKFANFRVRAVRAF